MNRITRDEGRRTRGRRRFAAGAWAILLSFVLVLCTSYFAPQARAQAQTLDAFERLEGWTALPSDGVKLDLVLDDGRHGQALRMDFDFHAGGGYAIARKAFPLDLPGNYRFRFSVRAEDEHGGPAPVNDLEFKLVDPTGDNVWWDNRRRFRYPTAWTPLTSKKRHLPFAWGPVGGGGEMEQVGWIEFVVTAVEGGRGSVWIDDFTFEPLPPDVPFSGTPSVTASSGDGAPAVDGDPATAWNAPGGAQTLTLDLGARHELGGLALTWDAAPAADYDVDLSEDGTEWTTGYTARGGRGGLDVVPLPDAEARFVRLRLLEPAGTGGYSLAEAEVLPLDASGTPNDLFREVARRTPPGRYPRYLNDEQTYWTVVGVDGDANEALVGEDGTVEVVQGRFSVEPFLYHAGRLLGWHEADSTTHALMDGYLPIPSATRHHGDLRLSVTAFAEGEPGDAFLILRYRVENTGSAADSVRLFLAARPFQVNPPQQWLNLPGGVGRIERLTTGSGDAFTVDGQVVLSRSTATASGAATFAAGDVTEWLARGAVPEAVGATDPLGHASGALAYDLFVPAGGAEEVVLVTPITRARPGLLPEGGLPRATASAEADRAQAQTAETWRAKLDRVSFILPPEAEALGQTLRSQLAYVLINRDGDAIQPGSRSYERSWIRDGALTSSALLRMGYPEAAEAFARWYAPYAFPSGKVPCCVDRRGADPTAENDSHGQLIFLIAEVHRFTGDDAFLRELWPAVEGAVAYMDTLRHRRMTPRYRADSLRAYYGLLPESISHEGYSAKPMHAFWDQLFALRGYHDAVYVAERLGEADAAARFAAARDTFAADLAASYRRTMAMHGIDYLPGAVELGDFDPTSVTIAMDPVDAGGVLPEGALEKTFERFWTSFQQRAASPDWNDYTPYEWRNVGALVRLGWKERAHEALAWYFGHRRPAAWNAFAEVVGRDVRRPRFVGDIPHTWVGSDFIRAVTDLFAYETGDALVLGAGIPEAWAASETGVGVEGLRTRHGPLSYRLRMEGEAAVYEVEAGLALPAGGLVLRPPFEGARSATVNGEPVGLEAGAVRVYALPARVVLRR